MGFNHVGPLRIEGQQPITVPFRFGNGDDLGAQYFAANPISTFVSERNQGNLGWVAMIDQQKSKTWAGGHATTLYYVTLRNLEPWGVVCDFDGGGF